MALKKVLTFTALLAAVSFAWGQVSITQGSLAPVGTTWETNIMYSATFDVGSGGTNQTWTFAEYTFDESATGEVVNPGTTPYTGDFPNANWALSGGGTSYTYFRVASNAAYWLGTGTSVGSTVFDEEALVMPFPCTYNTGWTMVASHTMSIGPLVITYTDSVINTVNGWGTLNTQFGSNSVLRVFGHTYNRIENNITGSDEYEYVGYIWYAANGMDVASVTSEDDVTDPNFTTGFLEISNFNVSADEPRGPVAQNFTVGQNYPNPFNPTTTLPVDVAHNERVTVKIYDETGRLVSQEEFELPAGQHNLPVNGSKWSDGYVFRQRYCRSRSANREDATGEMTGFPVILNEVKDLSSHRSVILDTARSFVCARASRIPLIVRDSVRRRTE